MTTNTEQQQAIWYVTGLAEVLFAPCSQDESNDAIVQFDRHRRTRMSGPLNAPRNTLGHAARRRLDQWGYVVVDNVEGHTAAAEFVSSVGELIPQDPEVDDRTYSKSAQRISVRTEAPSRHPSPAYVAVFCHGQARSGGGRTDLLDVRRLVGTLDADELALMTDAELHFPGPGGGVHSTMLSVDAQGDTVTRFSHDLLTTACDDPSRGADVDPSRLPLGEAGRALARRVSALFRELHTSVLIPDNSLLIWDNQRMLHARSQNHDRSCRLTRFWSTDWRRA